MDGFPQEIGEYKLIRPLGRGGMGEVFLAHDPALDRNVAIKVIAGFRDHPDARSRFAIEARAIGRLKHPNVVTVHRAGEVDGRPYLVSEYVDGTSLDRLPRVPVPRAIAIGIQLVRGLAAAHRENILHRDIKPANAILGDDGVVKLLDFGLAKLADEATPPRVATTTAIVEPATKAHGELSTITFDGASPALPGSPLELTAAGSRLGTPRYMSPEAWQGAKLTAASDVYSLGLVMWELIAGTHPFAELDGDHLAVRVPAADVPSISRVAGVPRAIAEVIDRCGKRLPEERFSDAVALLAALEPPVDAVRPQRLWGAALAALTLSGGGLAVALRDRGGDEPRAILPSPSVAPVDNGDLLPTPRALTTLGGCADQPAFIDASTIAFTLNRGDDVDVFTTTGTGEPKPFAKSAGWDWRATPGRHAGEVLYIRDGKEQFELAAFDRASAVTTVLGHASAAVALGDTIYGIGDDSPGLGTLTDGNLHPFIALPTKQAPFTVTGRADQVAIVVADAESAPNVCIVDVAKRRARCPVTTKLQNGRPALTADGRYLYYGAASGIRRLDLTTDRETAAVDGVRASGGIAISPDQRRLVFSDCRTYGSLIAISTTGDPKPEQIVGRGHARHPAPGPDGMLAWVAPSPGRGVQIMVRTRDRKERELYLASTEVGRSALDPSGTQLAFAIGGPGGGLRVLPVAGGTPVTWSTNPRDLGPIWLGTGLAFTRRGDGGVPSVMLQTGPTAEPRELIKGWFMEDLSRDGKTVLASAPNKLATIDVATGTVARVAVGIAKGDVNGARISPDGTWFLVLAGPTGATLYRVARDGKSSSVLYQLPPGQTVGHPAFLADGRVIFRPEIWLGELYELTGNWAAPAH